MLTLVIVTRNGAATLPALFEALSRIEVPAGGWKLVLADNGSTDDTRIVVERYQASLPIKYVFEPKPGVNVARNVALRYLEGNLVVFTDDDTIPDTDWLTSLHGVAEAQREYSMFGGTILPRWEREPPPWILHGEPRKCAATSPTIGCKVIVARRPCRTS
jgi:glycosyltransferase involved in cell wall biosynthesis